MRCTGIFGSLPHRAAFPVASLGLLAILAASLAAPPAEALQVNAQGLLIDGSTSLARISPLGTATLRIEPLKADADRCLADLAIEAGGQPYRLSSQEGNGFFISDVGRLVLIDTPETAALPGVIRVLDFTGAELLRREVYGPIDPQLSPDGTWFACGSRDGVVQLNLRSGRTYVHPALTLFATGPDGVLAGLRPAARAAQAGWELWIARGDAPANVGRLAADLPLRIAVSPNGAAVLVLERGLLRRIDLVDGAETCLFTAPAGARLRDLRIEGDALVVGIRHELNGRWMGELVRLSPRGEILERRAGPIRDIPRAAGQGGDAPTLPWPFIPAQGHPIGNTYCEYQNYGGAGYTHPGVDLFGAPGQQVFAVHSGQVKAVLTTSGQWHWRVAVADTAGSGYSTGYLYAHLDEPTIAVGVGDMVTQGQYLGDLVEWPVADFHHCHFARIRDSGTVWNGAWINTDNPHLDFTGHVDPDAPVFETAVGSQWLAFCQNETSTYLSPQNLQGQVDVIAHVGDVIGTTWVCTVQEIRYSIYPVGQPSQPVVDDKLAVYYDMWTDEYAGGPHDPLLVQLLYKRDSVCRTQGDYDNREFFHIITNSNGDQVYESSDLAEAWNTTHCSNGTYTIEVTAWDVAGNSATVSMNVQVNNPFSAVGEESLTARWVPVWQAGPDGAAAQVDFEVPRPGRVELAVHDVLGRRVSTLISGVLPAGQHTAVWAGRDASGHPVPAGTYFGRLAVPGAEARHRILIVR